MTTSQAALHSKSSISRSLGEWLRENWFGIFLVLYGAWIFAPFFAPLFMKMGWNAAGKAIYFTYSFFCHQLPERSIFLFGPKRMYSLGEIQAVWQNIYNPLLLRQFIGNEAMGWKVAWSDRMISFYTSFWVFAVAWWPLRRIIRPVSWFGFVFLLLPIALDGGSHMFSDLAGLGHGFRDTNHWLAVVTGSTLPAWFYAGDALGSFNSWARLVSGLFAGLALAWLVFPLMLQTMSPDTESP